MTSDPEAWEHFVRFTERPVSAAVLRTARKWNLGQPEVVQDVVQEVYLKLFQRRETFLRLLEKCDVEEAALALLVATAANAAHDYFRATKSSKRGGKVDFCDFEDHEPTNTKASPTPEQLVLLREIERSVRSATDDPRDRLVFWLYYRHGFTAKAISQLPSLGLSVKGVESVLFRVTKEVRQRLGPPLPILESQPSVEGNQ